MDCSKKHLLVPNTNKVRGHEMAFAKSLIHIQEYRQGEAIAEVCQARGYKTALCCRLSWVHFRHPRYEQIELGYHEHCTQMGSLQRAPTLALSLFRPVHDTRAGTLSPDRLFSALQAGKVWQ